MGDKGGQQDEGEKQVEIWKIKRVSGMCMTLTAASRSAKFRSCCFAFGRFCIIEATFYLRERGPWTYKLQVSLGGKFSKAISVRSFRDEAAASKAQT